MRVYQNRVCSTRSFILNFQNFWPRNGFRKGKHKVTVAAVVRVVAKTNTVGKK